MENWIVSILSDFQGFGRRWWMFRVFLFQWGVPSSHVEVWSWDHYWENLLFHLFKSIFLLDRLKPQWVSNPPTPSAPSMKIGPDERLGIWWKFDNVLRLCKIKERDKIFWSFWINKDERVKQTKWRRIVIETSFAFWARLAGLLVMFILCYRFAKCISRKMNSLDINITLAL